MNIRLLKAEAIAEAKLLRLKTKTKHKPTRQAIVDMDVDKIHTDEKRFQNRFNEFSEDSKNRIVKAVKTGSFDWAKFDPIIVWYDPAKRHFFVLSGHSRLAAFRELSKLNFEFLEIPVKIFKGTEQEAIDLAHTSNTLATKESDIERAMYWANRRKRCEVKGGLGALTNCEKIIAEEVKDVEGKNSNYIINLSYLNPSGFLTDSLNRLGIERDNDSTNVTRIIANWVGEARRHNKEISDLQETEIAKFLLNGGYGSKKGQFRNKAAFNERLKYSFDKWKAAGADPNKPLNLANTLSKSSFEQEHDARLEAAKRERDEAMALHEEKYNKYLQALIDGKIDQARMDELMKPLVLTVQRATDEVKRIREQKGDVMKASRSQTSLFGLDENMLKWDEALPGVFYLYFHINGNTVLLLLMRKEKNNTIVDTSYIKGIKEAEYNMSISEAKKYFVDYITSADKFINIFRTKRNLDKLTKAKVIELLAENMERKQLSLFGMLYGLEQETTTDEAEALSLSGNDDIYKYLTEKIIKLIDDKPLFWRRTWAVKTREAAYNFVSEKPYQGINRFILNFIAPMEYDQLGYEEISPIYMTFKQVKQAGGSVRKGAKAQPVYYFNFMYFKIVNGKKEKISKEEFERLQNQDRHRTDTLLIPFLRYYRVFNAVDIEDIDFPEKSQIEKTDAEQIASCEFIVDSYKDKPDIGLSTNGKAYYSPAGDQVRVPAIGFFEKEQNYYSTLFHELGHSTGHSKRLNRDMTGGFGSKKYAFEELIAEFTALFLSADAGIAYYTMDNSAAYIQGWNKSVKEMLKENNKAIFQASAAAQKARDHIMGGNSLDDFNPDNYESKSKGKRRKSKVKNESITKRLKLAEFEAKAKLKLLKLQKV